MEVASDNRTLRTLAKSLTRPTEKNRLYLSDAMRLSNHLRRSYPAYFIRANNGFVPGDFPKSVIWLDQEGKPLAAEDDDWSEVIANFSNAKERRIPIASHWKCLLPLNVKHHDGDKTNRAASWRHVVDDRMPSMLYLKVEDPREITDGDWMRLCFCENPNDDFHSYTYGEDFQRSTWSDHTYDRYWGSGMQTRYLCSGYHFTLVCKSGDGFSNLLEQHFRRHYFQMGLILHFQHATLLAKSANISEAVAFSRTDKERFFAAIECIQEELLAFTHQYWFTGVSNQLQARELYTWWRARLELPATYDEVMKVFPVSTYGTNLRL